MKTLIAFLRALPRAAYQKERTNFPSSISILFPEKKTSLGSRVGGREQKQMSRSCDSIFPFGRESHSILIISSVSPLPTDICSDSAVKLSP